MGCPHLGQRGSFPCKYPLRLVYSTVDWYIDKLRSIFSAIGRLGDWCRTLLIGNPSSDLLVKQYLKEFTAEQLRASIAPKQAVPPFAGKLFLLSRHIEKTSSPLVPLANWHVCHRQRSSVLQGSFLFWWPCIAGIWGKLRSRILLVSLMGMDSYHIWAKTLRDGVCNLFSMRRHPNPALCPIKGL